MISRGRKQAKLTKLVEQILHLRGSDVPWQVATEHDAAAVGHSGRRSMPLQATRTLELICRACGPPTLLLEPEAGDRVNLGEGYSLRC